jgi:hypothetical protein
MDWYPWLKTLHIPFAIVAVGLNVSYGAPRRPMVCGRGCRRTSRLAGASVQPPIWRA